MSDPLEFREDAKALVKAVEEAYDEAYSGDFPHPTDVAVIYDRALREAAAKALEWLLREPTVFHKNGEVVNRTTWVGNAHRAITALRTSSAPNAPKEAES